MVFYGANIFTAYSFIVCTAGSIAATVGMKRHSMYTGVEIFSNAVVFSEHKKVVFTGDEAQEYIDFYIMSLSDVEDVGSDKGTLFVRGNARHFCCPEEWVRYSAGDNGEIAFEHDWNSEFGGERVDMVRIKDYYTLGERILRRILICAERYRTDERKREQFRERMLAIAKTIDKKKGLTRKYVEPERRLPREGIKKRNW